MHADGPFQHHRDQAAKCLEDDEVLVVATNAEMTFQNDVHFPFRPSSNFWYLTGFGEPDSCLVLDASGHSTLFLRERNPQREIWDGKRLGVDAAQDALGVDHALPWDALAGKLPDLVGTRSAIVDAPHNPGFLELARNAFPLFELGAGPLPELRVKKSAWELAQMRKANAIGIAGMDAAMTGLQSGTSEGELEGRLLHAYRQHGSTGWGYPPIVGAGANAAVLHYVENQDTLNDGELILIDAGCEWNHYTSDITRTWAADGQFSELQGRIYDAVAHVQKEAIEAIRPGVEMVGIHQLTVELLSEAMVEWGILKDEPIDLKDGAHKQFYMHGTSHFLGLDVHDTAPKLAEGERRVLEPGMVITVEPGLYFNPNYATCPAGYAGIGVRLENDVVVTEDGFEDLTAALPSDRDALMERWA